MHTDEEILQLFRESVREVDVKVQLRHLSASTAFEEIGLDSVATMEVIGVLEEKLAIRFPDEDLATLNSVSDLVSLIQRLT